MRVTSARTLAGKRLGSALMTVEADASPFVDFDRSAWARLGENVPLPLTADELARLRSVGDEVDLTEVREVYLPLSRLLTLHVQESGRLYRAYRTFLNAQEARTPKAEGRRSRSERLSST